MLLQIVTWFEQDDQKLATIGVTLRNRKIYAGWVVEVPAPNRDLRHVSLVPLMSGYRDEKTLQPIYTKHYAHRFGTNFAPSEDIVLMMVALDDLLSAHLLTEDDLEETLRSLSNLRDEESGAHEPVDAADGCQTTATRGSKVVCDPSTTPDEDPEADG
jgi:hypothetical protein